MDTKASNSEGKNTLLSRVIQLLYIYLSQHAEWDLNKIEKLLTGRLWSGSGCIRGSEYVLFEILD